MRPTSQKFWINAALVAGALLLPFGSVLLLGAAAVKRARTTRQAENVYEEWWKLRALEREAAHAWGRNGDRRAPVPVPVRD